MVVEIFQWSLMFMKKMKEIGKQMDVENFKADGSIGGGIAFLVVGDHENRITDMTNVVVYKYDSESMGCTEQTHSHS